MSAISGCFRCVCLLFRDADGKPFTAVALLGDCGSSLGIEQSAPGVVAWVEHWRDIALVEGCCSRSACYG